MKTQHRQKKNGVLITIALQNHVSFKEIRNKTEKLLFFALTHIFTIPCALYLFLWTSVTMLSFPFCMKDILGASL